MEISGYAASIIPVRDVNEQIEVLLVQRSSQSSLFPGSWVFPGGMLELEDVTLVDEHMDQATSLLKAARYAGARETFEETGLRFEPEQLLHFSSWIPPKEVLQIKKTWFFLAQATPQSITVSQDELDAYCWITPSEALNRARVGTLMLEPPTKVTLSQLAKSPTVQAALASSKKRKPEVYRSYRLNPEDPTAGLSWVVEARKTQSSSFII